MAEPSSAQTASGSSSAPIQADRKWWQSSKGRQIFSKYALRRLFGYEGYRSIRQRNWTITNLLLLALGVVADVSEIFGPITRIGLYVSLAATLVFGIIIVRRLRFRNLCVVPFAVSLISIVIFGGAALAQQADKTPGNGVLADVFPLIADMQETLAAILETTTETGKKVEEIQESLTNVEASQERIEHGVQQLREQNIYQHFEVLSAIAEEKGVPKTAMVSHLVKLGAASEIENDEIPRFLERFAEEYLTVKRRLLTLDIDDPQLKEIRKRASLLLEDGKLDDARRILREAREIIKEGRQTSALKEATLVADEAAIDQLDLEYRIAAEKYLEASALVAFDQERQIQYRLSAASSLDDLGEQFGDTDALQDGIEILRSVLTDHNRDDDPYLWARTQNNLGLSLWRLGNRKVDFESLKQAEQAYRSALEVFTLEEFPTIWSTAQNNLAIVIGETAELNLDNAQLEKSITMLRRVIKERDREEEPLDWARVQHNIGTNLRTLGILQDNTQHLAEAREHLEQALQERTREKAPEEWADTQNALGLVLWTLGRSSLDQQQLDLARIAFENALTEASRDRSPVRWAMIQANLAATLNDLGYAEDNLDRFVSAAQAAQAALEFRSLEETPRSWGTTQANLGTAHWEFGSRTDDSAHLDKAKDAFEEALKVLRLEQSSSLWITSHEKLALTHLSLCNIREMASSCIEAASIYAKLAKSDLDAYFGDSYQQTLSFYHRANCGALIGAIDFSDKTTHFALAKEACDAAIAVSAENRYEHDWARGVQQLASLNFLAGNIDQDRKKLARSIELNRAVLDDKDTPEDSLLRERAKEDIARAESMLND